MTEKLLIGLGQVISYPTEMDRGVLDEVILEAEKDLPQLVESLKKFKEGQEGLSLAELQEIYTRTFDLKSLISLDIGYILFGEDYKRGEFLVQVQRLFNENNLEIGTELPDHLPNLLRLLVVMKDEEMKKEIIEKICLPALVKILSAFDQSTDRRDLHFYSLSAVKELFDNQYKLNDAVLKGAIC